MSIFLPLPCFSETGRQLRSKMFWCFYGILRRVSPGRTHPWRVFETVKVVNKAGRQRSRCHSPGLPGSSPVSAPSSSTSTPRTSCYGSDNASLTLEDKPSSSNTQKEDNRCVNAQTCTIILKRTFQNFQIYIDHFINILY